MLASNDSEIMIRRSGDVNMDKAKKLRLEAKGWTIGSVDEFLGLTPEEAAYVELKLSLSKSVKKYRRSRKLTQVEMARLMRSSQSRIAKIEAGDSSVSLDLLIRSLIAMGASRKDLAQIIASSSRA